MNPPTVMIVEDEESFVDALTISLQREGFGVEVARDGYEALQRFDTVDPDLILLDVMLPRIGGIDVCREVRKKSQVPIIMVTAKGGEIDAVVGLEVGADDYVVKPYRIHELVARMRAVLRRTVNDPTPPDGISRGAITVGDVAIDPEQYVAFIRGERTTLPLKEFELLLLLLSHSGRVLTRESIMDRIWGHDYVGDTKTLDVHVKRLRTRVETDPANPTRIVTVRGVGYKYERQRSAAE